MSYNLEQTRYFHVLTMSCNLYYFLRVQRGRPPMHRAPACPLHARPFVFPQRPRLHPKISALVRAARRLLPPPPSPPPPVPAPCVLPPALRHTPPCALRAPLTTLPLPSPRSLVLDAIAVYA